MSDHEEKAEERAERAGSLISQSTEADADVGLAILAQAEATLSVAQRSARLAELLEPVAAALTAKGALYENALEIDSIEDAEKLLDSLGPDSKAVLAGLLVRDLTPDELRALLTSAGATLEPEADEFGLTDSRPLSGFTDAEIAVMDADEFAARTKREQARIEAADAARAGGQA